MQVKNCKKAERSLENIMVVVVVWAVYGSMLCSTLFTYDYSNRWEWHWFSQDQIHDGKKSVL